MMLRARPLNSEISVFWLEFISLSMIILGSDHLKIIVDLINSLVLWSSAVAPALLVAYIFWRRGRRMALKRSSLDRSSNM